MENYRATISHPHLESLDYWKNFSETRKCLAIVEEIKRDAHFYGIKKIWHFFEPFIEITWLGTKENSEALYKTIFDNYKGTQYKVSSLKTPADGAFADWFCCNEEERLFGAETHAAVAQIVSSYYEHQEGVDSGKGLKAQVGRTIHRICNPLGLNYKDEAAICFSRGLICLLFRFFSFKRAVWIYQNIFRQTY